MTIAVDRTRSRRMETVDADVFSFLNDLVLRSLAAAVGDVVDTSGGELEDRDGVLLRLLDNIAAVAEALEVVDDHVIGEYVRPRTYRGPRTTETVSAHVDALRRFAEALPKAQRPRNARERALRGQERAAYLAPWKKQVLGSLRVDPTSRSWESRADAPQRLYLVAWQNWVKLGHGTDARVRQHLTNPDCHVLQVVEARHVDIAQAERDLRHRFSRKRKPGRNIKLQMPRSFGAGRELVPYREIADFDLLSLMSSGGALDVTAEY
ncbi:hypothetical protein WY02_05665 [Pseudonocardia sp. AL041005-10]|nr:hypothetical protein WY02_05665 [Pseudonocardia sp. AL041005-10]